MALIQTDSYSKNKANSSGNGSGSNVTKTNIITRTERATEADKLSEKHMIWGNEFDGTQDVKGDLTIEQNHKLTVKGNVEIDSYTNDKSFVHFNGAEDVSKLSELDIEKTNIDMKDGSFHYENSDNSSTIDIDKDGIMLHGSNSLHSNNINTDVIGSETADIITVTAPLQLTGGLDLSGQTLRVGTIYSNDITNDGEIKTQDLTVYGNAHFFNLVIDEVQHAGGSIILSAADFKVDAIEDGGTYTVGTTCQNYFISDNSGSDVYHTKKLYQVCYDEATDTVTDNKWVCGDHVYCKSFNLDESVQKYYWTAVVAVESDVYAVVNGRPERCNMIEIVDDVDTSETANIKATLPQGAERVGDEIALFGSKVKYRRDAIAICAVKSIDPTVGSPCIIQYTDINGYTIEGKQYTYLSKTGNLIRGDLRIQSGDKVEDFLEKFKDENPYIHVAYANSSDGQTDFTKNRDEIEKPKYIGYCSNYDVDDSELTYEDYSWSKYYVDEDSMAQMIPVRERIYVDKDDNLWIDVCYLKDSLDGGTVEVSLSTLNGQSTTYPILAQTTESGVTYIYRTQKVQVKWSEKASTEQFIYGRVVLKNTKGEVVTARTFLVTWDAGAFLSITDSIKTRVTDCEGNISTLNQTAESIAARVASLEGGEGDSSLVTRVGALEVRVDGIDASVSELSSGINNVSGELATTNEKVSEIELRVDEIALGVKETGGGENLLDGTDFGNYEITDEVVGQTYTHTRHITGGYTNEKYILTEGDDAGTEVNVLYKITEKSAKLGDWTLNTTLPIKFDNVNGVPSVHFGQPKSTSKLVLNPNDGARYADNSKGHDATYGINEDYYDYLSWIRHYREYSGKTEYLIMSRDFYDKAFVILPDTWYTFSFKCTASNSQQFIASNIEGKPLVSTDTGTKVKIKIEGIQDVEYVWINGVKTYAKDGSWFSVYYEQPFVDTPDNLPTFSFTFKTPATQYSYSSVYIKIYSVVQDAVCFYQHISTGASATHYYWENKPMLSYVDIGGLKFEQGQVPTPWSSSTKDLESRIEMTSTSVDIYVRNGLEKTGINIEDGTITMNAQNTIIDGTLNITERGSGIIMYDDENSPCLNIQKSAIGTLSSIRSDASGNLAWRDSVSGYENEGSITKTKTFTIGDVASGDIVEFYGIEKDNAFSFNTNVTQSSTTKYVVCNCTMKYVIKIDGEEQYTKEQTKLMHSGNAYVMYEEYWDMPSFTAQKSGQMTIEFTFKQDSSSHLQSLTYMSYAGLSVYGKATTLNLYLDFYYKKDVKSLTRLGTDGIYMTQGNTRNLYFGVSGFQTAWYESSTSCGGLKLDANDTNITLKQLYTAGMTGSPSDDIWGCPCDTICQGFYGQGYNATNKVKENVYNGDTSTTQGYVYRPKATDSLVMLDMYRSNRDDNTPYFVELPQVFTSGTTTAAVKYGKRFQFCIFNSGSNSSMFKGFVVQHAGPNKNRIYIKQNSVGASYDDDGNQTGYTSNAYWSSVHLYETNNTIPYIEFIYTPNGWTCTT